MDNISIKNNIRKIRKARKLTQEEMAHLLGISVTAYRDLEKGSTSVMNSNIGKIAQICDTSAEEVILGYRPIQVKSSTDEKIIESLIATIKTLETRIEDMEKTIKAQEETIRTKDEVITMLKRPKDQI